MSINPVKFSQQNKQDDDYWSQLISRVPKKAFIPLPRKATSKKNILDDVFDFIKQRDLMRSAINQNAFSTAFNATVRSEEVRHSESLGKKDVSTMTTFEPSFLKTIGKTVKKEEVEEEDDVVPNSQPLDFAPEPFATEPPVEIKWEIDDFMRAVFERTEERAKKDVEDVEDPSSYITDKPEYGDSDQMMDQGRREEGVARVVSVQRTSYLSTWFQDVVSTEVKSRPYVTSILGEASQRTKHVQNILYSKTSDVLNPRSNADRAPPVDGTVRSENTVYRMKDTIVDNIMSDIMGTKKRKKHVISGVDLRKHPEPTVLAEKEAMSQGAQQNIRMSLENGEVVFTKPRPPRPMSPGTIRLRKQLGLEPKKGKKTATPVQPGSRKRSLTEESTNTY